ncbi:MAG: sigma-70 family RNA polymerase sigma factor [Clostridia bacterium]|nr:sigma-70 family RNA polymerase sigma factor [Clostridia bacterium]
MNPTNKVETEKLYKKYYGELFYFAKKRSLNNSEAEDSVQDCFLEIVKNPNTISKLSDRSKQAYLKTIVKRKLSNASAKRLNYLQNIDENELLIEEKQTDEIVLNRILTEKIFDQIKNLPEERRLMFSEYFIEGKSYAELAENYGISRDNSRQILYRIVKSLRKVKMENEN